jgi:hypothetical protein
MIDPRNRGDGESWNRNLAARIQSPASGRNPLESQRSSQGSNEDRKETAVNDTGTTCWKEAYEKTLREKDKQKLGDLILSAEAAIFRRYQELAPSSDHHEERRSLKEAAENLLSLKVNQLGWPPVQ